uniref:F-box domain-containing protein n=1 Tax=Panagrolaimus sp. ES5 TaxID=591445 RepID=A0AC34G4U2_9BILA
MPDFRQNFKLPYPIICRIIEKIEGDDAYKLANTCKFMQKMCHRQQIPNLPPKILNSILRKLSPIEVFDFAQTSKYMWNLTRDICKRQVNVLSIDENAYSEVYLNENDQHLCLNINHKVVEFTTDNSTVRPNLQFEELLEMLKDVEIMRIDISNLKFTPNIKNIALDWNREKPIKIFAFMRLPKNFSTAICIEFIEKFAAPDSEFNLSFARPNRGFHERYHSTIQNAIDKARADDRSHKGLAGVTRWRCEEQIY